MKHLITLPDGRKVDTFEISEIGKIVKLSEEKNGAGNLLGFSISLSDGAMLNVVRSFNEDNYLEISDELNNLRDVLNKKKDE